jgi:hypothetical protein
MQRNRKLTSQPAEMQALETCEKSVSIPNAKSGLKQLEALADAATQLKWGVNEIGQMATPAFSRPI